MIFFVSAALAESWCAAPLLAHEWGVTVLQPQGGSVRTPGVPDHFYSAGSRAATQPAVRTLPPDTGIRDLPVVHFYAGKQWSQNIPVGLEVGFTRGEASRWYPAVSHRVDAEQANGARAHASRAQVVSQRMRNAFEPRTDPGRDPTKQLHWDHLVLTAEPITPPADAKGWVDDARAVESLWVNGPGESERFVFYEADTQEAPALVIERGTEGPNHYILRNTSDWDVSDVAFVHDGRMWTAPKIPAGKSAGFLLEDRHDPAVLTAFMEERWSTPFVAPEDSWDPCVMMRDPAVPADKAAGHRVFPAELATLFAAWGSDLTGASTHLVYREDTAALDAVMPVSLYTDMYHDPSIHRLGVVLVLDPPLP